MGKLTTGIDMGRTGARFLQASNQGGALKLTHCFFRERGESETTQETLSAVSREAGWKMGDTRIGITGRDVILRYTKVPPVPDSQLRNLMKFEIEDLAHQSGGDIAADFNLLPIPTDFSGEDTVLLALAKNNLLDSFLEAQAGTSAKINSFTPNPVALYNAYLKFGNPGKETVLLANLGSENVDLALVVGSDLYFARNITGGSSALTEAVAGRFNISLSKAEQLKKQFADVNPSLKTSSKGFESSQHEKVTNAILGSLGQIPSMLQSTVMFCKTQTKTPDLKLGKVLLCGGGARLKGLTEYLKAAMGVPVELFDPFEEVDRSLLSDEEATQLDRNRLESVVPLGLAIAGIDSSLYSIEILPDSIKKGREFASKTVFLIVAGVALLVYLGADFWLTKGRAEVATVEADRLHRMNEQRKKTDKQANDDLNDSKLLSSRAVVLEQKVGVGSVLVQTLRMLQEELPADLWVSGVSVELRSQKDSDLRIDTDPVPIVHIEGKGKEGASSLAQTFQSFTEKVRSKIPQGALKQTVAAQKNFTFTLEMNYFVRENQAPEEKVEEKPEPKKTERKKS